jgi:hypothetical protein
MKKSAKSEILKRIASEQGIKVIELTSANADELPKNMSLGVETSDSLTVDEMADVLREIGKLKEKEEIALVETDIDFRIAEKKDIELKARLLAHIAKFKPRHKPFNKEKAAQKYYVLRYKLDDGEGHFPDSWELTATEELMVEPASPIFRYDMCVVQRTSECTQVYFSTEMAKECFLRMPKLINEDLNKLFSANKIYVQADD